MQETQRALKAYGNYIAGEWVAASSGETYETRDPSRTSEVVGRATALKQHRKRRAEEKLTALHWDEQGFVFTKLSGGYLHPNTLYSTYFKPLRDRAGVPPIHFHDLRHTCATLALLNGVPVKVVSEILGNRDIATTLRTYAHVLPGMQGQAARRMDSVLFGQG